MPYDPDTGDISLSLLSSPPPSNVHRDTEAVIATQSDATSGPPFTLSSEDPSPSARLGWAKQPGDPPLLDNATGQRLNRWIKQIVVCNFDLEKGPVIEREAVDRRWGPGEKQNVAFSSFPDTSLFTEGSIQFSFKIRQIPPESSSQSDPSPPPREPFPSTDKAAEYRRWDERGREWLYGFVWFHQERDQSIARGYMQKSVVILTHLPFPALFSAVLERLVPPFFKTGYPALEAACHSIASWPDPTPDTVLTLAILSDLIRVKLPDTTEAPQVGNGFPLLATLPRSTPLRTLAPILPSLWSLWECLLLAEPILVIAPDPKTCSEIVWWLRDLLRPIPPAGDFRPYLHIHDHDFSLLVNTNKPQTGVVVGVTNPFFRDAAAHWPNVVSITSQSTFITRRHRSVLKDKHLLKHLQTLVAEGKHDDPDGNNLLRTHFQQLTDKMLVPLNRYFQTLVPLASSSSPIKPFSLPNFLTHLRNHGPNPLSFRTKGLSTKRVETEFYTAFCMGGCFAGWLAQRMDSLGFASGSTSSLKAGSTSLPMCPTPPASTIKQYQSTDNSESDSTRPSSEGVSEASHRE